VHRVTAVSGGSAGRRRGFCGSSRVIRRELSGGREDKPRIVSEIS
jgi:hypothetical protein